MWKSLSDVNTPGVRSWAPKANVRIEVWYRIMFAGVSVKFDPANPEATHARLGAIWQEDASLATLELLWMELQGEMWSPNGEACDLIKSRGLSHTSMSVGDVFHVLEGPRTGWWRVDSTGFSEVKGESANGQ